jgi:hypothetical protein
MATDHRGRPLHAGKRTSDEIGFDPNLMGNPSYNAGDPLLQKATVDKEIAALANIEYGEYKEPTDR